MLFPTSHTAVSNYFAKKADTKEAYHVTENDVSMSMEAKAWALEHFGEKVDDFSQNIVAVLSRSVIKPRHAGLVTYAIGAYFTKINTVVAENKKNEFFGVVGDKFVVEATVLSKKPVFSDYGTTYLITFDVDGLAFKWFSSNDIDFKAGDKVFLAGTIKDHSTWNGENQTVVTRCKATAEAPVAKAKKTRVKA